MSWLDDFNKTRVYKYSPEDDSCEPIYGTKEELEALTNNDRTCEPGDSFTVEFEDGAPIKYCYGGMEPKKLDMMSKITFEKNGRKGVAVNFGNGKIAKRSQTKENYMNGKGTKSVLTRACQEASEKENKKYVHKRLKSTLNEMKRQNHLAKEKARGRK